jgi:hypothetical protein
MAFKPIADTQLQFEPAPPEAEPLPSPTCPLCTLILVLADCHPYCYGGLVEAWSEDEDWLEACQDCHGRGYLLVCPNHGDPSRLAPPIEIQPEDEIPFTPIDQAGS